MRTRAVETVHDLLQDGTHARESESDEQQVEEAQNVFDVDGVKREHGSSIGSSAAGELPLCSVDEVEPKFFCQAGLDDPSAPEEQFPCDELSFSVITFTATFST